VNKNNHKNDQIDLPPYPLLTPEQKELSEQEQFSNTYKAIHSALWQLVKLNRASDRAFWKLEEARGRLEAMGHNKWILTCQKEILKGRQKKRQPRHTSSTPRNTNGSKK